MDTYSVICHGKKSLVLRKHGNKRATRAYKDGMEMTANIGWYLANRDCQIFIHNKNADTVRTIVSCGVRTMKRRFDVYGDTREK